MIYGSVCSGIEAATVAWHSLGWRAAWFSEIGKFPSAVLAHHYPTVPNLGDMTRFEEWPNAAIDLLVGGTPCQSYSIAGLRKGLDDPRGELMLTYLAIARRYAPRWVVWENVPGVLSSNGGRDFGTLLGGLAELGYGFAYRVLDAQYIRVESHARAVPQRRRRVFVVGYLGDWRRAAAVLFERESMLGHPAPRRAPGQSVAPTVSARTRSGGGFGADFECNGGLIQQAFGGNNTSGAIDVAAALNAKSTQRQDFETETLLVAHALRAEGFDASEDGSGRGTPIVPVPFDPRQITSPTHRAAARPGDPCHTLAATTHAPAIAFDCKAGGDTAFSIGPVAGTLRGEGFGGGHAAALVSTAVRRLMPRECERLQGFPDDYTAITVKGKRAKDGPRYKAIGNSMAIPPMRWIGERIAQVDSLATLQQGAA
ncbi:DNA cytosine methyltransferase [Burkholderia ubonensis]|uniref:DNA cytosine methyltransferase n=1 Tax=Burkholderia ubonensis TaxID=101571 RepID=UPI0007C843F8|nr:DNA cytosine methyltransferase [Burkholderia ubonensis]